jgi:hypothetical protein
LIQAHEPCGHSSRHDLVIEATEAATRGVCTCGAWEHEIGPDTVAVTGRSREETLRAAHDLHVREIMGA